jgi:hypothetical protein
MMRSGFGADRGAAGRLAPGRSQIWLGLAPGSALVQLGGWRSCASCAGWQRQAWAYASRGAGNPGQGHLFTRSSLTSLFPRKVVQYHSGKKSHTSHRVHRQ